MSISKQNKQSNKPLKKLKLKRASQKHNKDSATNAIVASKTSDSKISQTAIHLEYLFERGVDFKSRTITITGDIAFPAFDLVDAAMAEFERVSKKGVTIKIHSGGGSVYEALAIVGRLRASKCHITTEGYGHMMSAATLILSCGDKRRVSEYAFFMHHESSYGLSGRHSEVKAEVEQMEQEERKWAKWMANFTGREEEYWYEIGKHVNLYLDAYQCLDHGIADEVI